MKYVMYYNISYTSSKQSWHWPSEIKDIQHYFQYSEDLSFKNNDSNDNKFLNEGMIPDISISLYFSQEQSIRCGKFDCEVLKKNLS